MSLTKVDLAEADPFPGGWNAHGAIAASLVAGDCPVFTKPGTEVPLGKVCWAQYQPTGHGPKASAPPSARAPSWDLDNPVLRRAAHDELLDWSRAHQQAIELGVAAEMMEVGLLGDKAAQVGLKVQC